MVINGETRSLFEAESSDLMQLVRSLGLDPVGIAVEINGQLPPREDWADIILKDNDVIEIIRFVGGG